MPDIDFSMLFAILAALAVSGLIGHYIAKQKGRDPLEGFLFGFFLVAIGWIIEGLLPEIEVTPRISGKQKKNGAELFRDSLTH